MPLIRDHAQQPPGGHHYPDPSGVTLRAKDIDGVIEAMESYRASNALPAGDPGTELEAYYITRFPWLITKVGVTIAQQPDPVARWLNRIWREAPNKFVETKEYQGRVAICSTCEHYGLPPAFNPDSLRRLISLSQGRPIDRAACKLHGWVCGMAALLPAPESARTHASCWASNLAANSGQ